MLLGAGLLIACAAGAAVAGAYFPAGIVLAALFVGFVRRSERGFPYVGRGDGVIHRTVRAGTQLTLAAMIAGTAAAYLAPGEQGLVAAGLVVVAGVAAVWLDVPDVWRRTLAGVLAVAAVVFAGVCFGLAPVEANGLGGERMTLVGVVAAVPGVLLTGVLFVPLLDVGARRWMLVRLATGTALAVAVS
ncbi:MAG: hypothetical protein GEV04_09620 [Actinophytocola sp.]|nr:hypothetical protein [Actinophytocola sp.]